MSDLRAVIDSMRQLQEDSAIRQAESSDEVRRLLESANALLQGAQNGSGAVLAADRAYDARVHEEIQHHLQVVGQIASNLRNGRY